MSDFEDPELMRTNREAQEDEDRFADNIEDFVEEVEQRMLQAGITANDAWMFFRTYQSVGNYPLLPETSEVDIALIKKVVDLGSNPDIPTATSIRVVRTQKINVPGGVEHLIQDASIDELGEVHYLPDMVFIRHTNVGEDGEELNTEGLDKEEDLSDAHPYIPLVWLDGGQLKAGYHKLSEEISHPVVSVREGGTAMPFGDFESLFDERYNFDQIQKIFAQIKGLSPDFTGELAEDI